MMEGGGDASPIICFNLKTKKSEKTDGRKP